ncbi:hypothetical protein ACVWZM_006030 [Bradyrhizobium sp. USDA 4501]
MGRRKKKALSQAQLAHMEELLDQVLEKERKKQKKSKINKTSLAFDSHTKNGINGRADWPVETYDRFVIWCREEYEVTAELRETNEPDHILKLSDSMPVGDEDGLDAATGRYIFLTLIGTESARVTWIEMKQRESDARRALFEAKRGPTTEFEGFYYASQNSVFLLGEIPGTQLPRGIYLTTSRDPGRPRDMIGMTSGSSNKKFVFGSACYAWATDDDVEQLTGKLDVQPLSSVRELYPNAVAKLMEFAGVQMSIDRPADE